MAPVGVVCCCRGEEENRAYPNGTTSHALVRPCLLVGSVLSEFVQCIVGRGWAAWWADTEGSESRALSGLFNMIQASTSGGTLIKTQPSYVVVIQFGGYLLGAKNNPRVVKRVFFWSSQMSHAQTSVEAEHMGLIQGLCCRTHEACHLLRCLKRLSLKHG